MECYPFLELQNDLRSLVFQYDMSLAYYLADVNVRSMDVRCEGDCSLPLIFYCWQSFSPTSSPPLQSVTLLACSLDASSCMPGVVLYYYSVQGPCGWDFCCSIFRGPSKEVMLGKLCHVTEHCHTLPIFTVTWVLANAYVSLTNMLVWPQQFTHPPTGKRDTKRKTSSAGTEEDVVEVVDIAAAVRVDKFEGCSYKVQLLLLTVDKGISLPPPFLTFNVG
ncbi:hypothetical protein MG293_000947 [Ovis ammon polii]|uniref:Uncharacterized protein n=1 Tax=Ovis ammon polii TaxID=230172 RepID=A0AAD4UPI1_OVIAM|nr:hypothetical protein MG293_000947 [Ovis ammon polii]